MITIGRRVKGDGEWRPDRRSSRFHAAVLKANHPHQQCLSTGDTPLLLVVANPNWSTTHCSLLSSFLNRSSTPSLVVPRMRGSHCSITRLSSSVLCARSGLLRSVAFYVDTVLQWQMLNSQTDIVTGSPTPRDRLSSTSKHQVNAPNTLSSLCHHKQWQQPKNRDINRLIDDTL